MHCQCAWVCAPGSLATRRWQRPQGCTTSTTESRDFRASRVARRSSTATSRGRTIRDVRTLDRIRSLVIPPAWTQVWICARADGHLQATGRDARGRKQHRYHPRWTAARDCTKFDQMIEFALALPAIRKRVEADLRRTPLSREHALGTVVTLLEKTLIRIGNREYARTNKSFGLTTLLNEHVEIKGASLRFHFRAKSGVMQTIELNDATLARSVRSFRALPGRALFQYVDAAGNRQCVDSVAVNTYFAASPDGRSLRRISGRGRALSSPPRLSAISLTPRRTRRSDGTSPGDRFSRGQVGKHASRFQEVLHPPWCVRGVSQRCNDCRCGNRSAQSSPCRRGSCGSGAFEGAESPCAAREGALRETRMRADGLQA